VFLASHAHLQGRLEDCERLTHEALTPRFGGQDELVSRIFGAQMMVVRGEQGRLDELVETVRSVAAQYPQLIGWRCTLASVYARLARHEDARQELETLARADFDDLPHDTYWLSNMTLLAEVVASLDDAPRAQVLYDLLLPYADRCAVTFALLCRGSVSRPLGLLATTQSRYTEAAQHFEQALTMNERIRSPLWIAHTQHDYARMLLVRNDPGDRCKALKLLQRAIATADELGLKALADKAGPLRLTAEAAAPPTSGRRSV
jgi:tetratricopeptide (TPR) repeat protein